MSTFPARCRPLAAFGFGLLLLLSGHIAPGEQPAATPDKKPVNPFAGNEGAIAEGGTLFRQNCAGCHGLRGKGGRGPDLTDARWLHGSDDQDVFRVIRNGVRGTTMKEISGLISDEKVWKIIAFVRSLARTGTEPDWQPYLTGDPAAGKKLFFDEKGKANCIKCHSLQGAGRNIGPQLAAIAVQRSPRYLMESLVLPSADIDPNYESVVVMTRAGQVITGVKVNDDNFSIQLREQETGRFHSFLRSELSEVQHTKKSLMPENLVEQLTVKELHDLFAYLLTLDGGPAAVGKGPK